MPNTEVHDANPPVFVHMALHMAGWGKENEQASPT